MYSHTTKEEQKNNKDNKFTKECLILTIMCICLHI